MSQTRSHRRHLIHTPVVKMKAASEAQTEISLNIRSELFCNDQRSINNCNETLQLNNLLTLFVMYL